jgi:hypothetical protein
MEKKKKKVFTVHSPIGRTLRMRDINMTISGAKYGDTTTIGRSVLNTGSIDVFFDNDLADYTTIEPPPPGGTLTLISTTMDVLSNPAGSAVNISVDSVAFCSNTTNAPTPVPGTSPVPGSTVSPTPVPPTPVPTTTASPTPLPPTSPITTFAPTPPPTPLPPLPIGSACFMGAQPCVSGSTCVDGFCCNSACAGPCESCDQVGLRGTCTPTCTDPVGCVSDECSAQAVSCLDIVSGFNGSSCEVFASPNRGVCRPRAGACYPMTHNATVCKQISVVAPFSCASMGCVKSNTCVPGAAKQTVDNIGEICFTSADSSALDSCASPSERCDDRGSCVVTVTPAPPTSAPTPAPPTLAPTPVPTPIPPTAPPTPAPQLPGGLNAPTNGWLLDSTVFTPLIGKRGGDVSIPIALGIAAQSDIIVMGSQVGLAPTTTFVSGAMTITFGMVFALHGVQLSGTSDSLVITTTAADGTQTRHSAATSAVLNWAPAIPVQSVTLSGGAVGLLRVSVGVYDAPPETTTSTESTTPPTTANATTPTPTTKFDVVEFVQTPTGIYAAAGAGAGVLLLIIVIVIVCCCLVRRGRQRGAKTIPDAIMVSIRRSSYRSPQFQMEMQSEGEEIPLQSPRSAAKQYSAFSLDLGQVRLPPPPVVETASAPYHSLPSTTGNVDLVGGDEVYRTLPATASEVGRPEDDDGGEDGDDRPYAFKPGRKNTEAQY